MADVQSARPPPIDHKLLEAVTEGNAAELIELLNIPQPPRTPTDHVVIPIPDPDNGGGMPGHGPGLPRVRPERPRPRPGPTGPSGLYFRPKPAGLLGFSGIGLGFGPSFLFKTAKSKAQAHEFRAEPDPSDRRARNLRPRPCIFGPGWRWPDIGGGIQEGNITSMGHGDSTSSYEHVGQTTRSERLLQGVTSDGDGVLHIAARFERVNLVREIPKSWSDAVNVAAANKRGETALHCAAASGNVDMISLVISFATDDNKKRHLLRMKSHSGETCLHDAVRYGKKEAVERLIHEDVGVFVGPNDSHALVRIHDNKGVSPLYLATTLRQLEIVKFLTDKQECDGVQYPAASYYGPGSKTALHAAVLLSKELSEYLAEWKKELIDKEDAFGSTPFHLLASTKDRIIMKLLLEMDTTAGYRADQEGSLPIHVAAANGSRQMVKLLFESRPNCSSSCNNLGQTILHVAVQNGGSNVVDYICSGHKFARIFNIRDTDGNTALHLAVLQGRQLIFCRLMQRREVCLSFSNKDERTPLDLAQLSTPPGISFWLKAPQHWIMYALVLAGADYGTCRSDHLATNVAKSDREKESELISKSAGPVAVCAVLILTTAFAAPFSVTKFYDKREKDLTTAFAYRAFVMSDAMAFAFSAVAISYSTLAGFSLTSNMRRRPLYLGAGVASLCSAAVCIVIVFTAGVYVAVAPVLDISTDVFVCLFGALAAFIVVQLMPLLMMFRHTEALIRRLGFSAWCRAMICMLPRQRRDTVPLRYRGLYLRELLMAFLTFGTFVMFFGIALMSAKRDLQA